MKTSIAFLSLLMMVTLTSSTSVQVDRALVRVGPGAFFPVVAELPRGFEFEVRTESEGWLHIAFEDTSGYVSSRVSGDGRRPAPGRGGVAQSTSGRADFNVSATGISAAVRGFMNQYAASLNVPDETLDLLAHFQPDYQDYLRFREETYRGKNRATYRRGHRLPRLRHEMLYYPVDEEGAGLALAANIASAGLLNNPGLLQYINNVGTIVVEASHAYDLGFRFFVLETEEVKAMATPGGTIFVSVGMLRWLTNEAELAAVLAHEIAHVTMRHGLTEMDIREPLSRARDAFRQLDDAVTRTEEQGELVRSLNQAYLDYSHRIYAPRTNVYEHEADEMAMTYLARSGYHPQALHNLVFRLLNEADRDSYPYIVGDILERYENLQRVTSQRRYGTDYMYFHERYADIMQRNGIR